MMSREIFELNRRQVLIGVAAGCAVSMLPISAIASSSKSIRYKVARFSTDQVMSTLQTQRDDTSSRSQLVLGNDDHVLILSGAYGGTGGVRLEI